MLKIKRNWVFATKSNFRIPISLQPDDENLSYVKVRLFNLTEFMVWNIKGRLRHWVAIDIGIRKLEVVAKTQFLCGKII